MNVAASEFLSLAAASDTVVINGFKTLATMESLHA
jgi:hypothetical protein